MMRRQPARALRVGVVGLGVIGALLATGALAAPRAGAPGATPARPTARPLTGGCSSALVLCTGQIAVSAPAEIFTPPNTLGVGSATVFVTNGSGSGSGSDDLLVTAAITGDAAGVFTIQDPQCSPVGAASCTFAAPPPLPPTHVLPIGCLTTDTKVVHSATLTVTGASAGSDAASTTITCEGSGSGSSSTASLTYATTLDVTAPVGGSATVSDLFGASGSAITFDVVAQTGSDVFSVLDCGAMCTLTSGSSTPVRAEFQPVHWGDRTGSLHVDCGSGSLGCPGTITITGHGSGAEVSLTPAITSLALGPVPIGQPQTATITLLDDGNISVATSISGLSGALATSTGALTLSPGSAAFDVTCGSSAPTAGTVMQTLSIRSPAAYVGSDFELPVTCDVANTHVQVTPTAFDFGQVRVGATIAGQALTIANTTSGTVTLQSVTVSEPTGASPLTLSPAIAPNLALPAGGSATTTLTLATGAPVDLDTPNQTVTVVLQEAGSAAPVTLQLPVTGQVATESSTIAPATLDLGTACVGHAVTATEHLTNTGTGTLHVQPPTIDQAFTLTFTDPTTYPTGGAALAPGGTAVVTLTPTSTAAGVHAGTLTWSDDVPSQYSVPVTLTSKADGTAVSPLTLAFGTVPVGIASPASTLTIENCADAPTTIQIGSVNAVTGTAEAWQVAPSGPQTIPGRGKLLVEIAFAPHYADPYDASLQLVVDGQPTAVQLTGQGDGTARARTFYNCGGCQGGGGAAGGALVVGAALLSRRRRRGSS